MMANYKHDANYEDEEEADKQHQLSDDWLSKEELLNRRAAENKKREVINSNKPQKLRREENILDPQANPTTENAPESVVDRENDPPNLQQNGSRSESDHSVTEGPTSSLRLQPRKRIQRKLMNIGHSNVKSYFTSMDLTRELQIEITGPICTLQQHG